MDEPRPATDPRHAAIVLFVRCGRRLPTGPLRGEHAGRFEQSSRADAAPDAVEDRS